MMLLKFQLIQMYGILHVSIYLLYSIFLGQGGIGFILSFPSECSARLPLMT